VTKGREREEEGEENCIANAAKMQGLHLANSHRKRGCFAAWGGGEKKGGGEGEAIAFMIDNKFEWMLHLERPGDRRIAGKRGKKGGRGTLAAGQNIWSCLRSQVKGRMPVLRGSKGKKKKG